jgi:hypothetical protein
VTGTHGARAAPASRASPPARSAGRAARRYVSDRWAVLIGGLLASLPIIVTTAHAVAIGWVPVGDDAYTAIRAFDVFTADSPLVGQWSAGASEVSDGVTYSPGPLLFWLLALPARFAGPSVMIVTVGLLNVASVIGVVGLARRRGGWPLMVAVAVAVPLMLASLPSETYSDVWNSSVALLPLTLLIFLAWSLACGEYRLAPLTVLVGSFVAQAHLTYVAPALLVGGFAIAGLVASRLGGWGPNEPRALRSWALAALLVGIACWSGALIDEAIHSPGNLVLLERAATSDQPTAGFDAGWRAAVHAVGVPPWWLQEPRKPLARISDLVDVPSLLANAAALLVVGALAVVAVLGWRSRRPDVSAGAALGLVLCLAVAVDAASTPTIAMATIDYTLRWGSIAGMATWLLLAWSVVALFWPARRSLDRQPTVRAALAGLALAGVVGGFVAARAHPRHEYYWAMRIVADRIEGDPNLQRPTRVDVSSSGDFVAVGLQAGIVYALRRQGLAVTAPTLAPGLGRAYATGDYEQVLRVDVNQPPPAGARPIARLSVAETFAEGRPRQLVIVSLVPRGNVR